MTASIAELGERLQDQLKLSNRPLAITFSAEAPVGIERFQGEMPAPTEDGRTGAVPASCVFWIKAQDGGFTTTGEDHGNCSVGSLETTCGIDGTVAAYAAEDSSRFDLSQRGLQN